jgi:hypothetical protein
VPYVVDRTVMLAEFGRSVVVSATPIKSASTTAVLEIATAVDVAIIETAAIAKSTTSASWSISRNTSADSYVGSVYAHRCGTELLAFRGDTRTNLDVGLFYDHTALKLTAASPAMLRGQSPLTIGVGEPRDGNDTDAGLIVAAISGTEAYTPPSLSLSVQAVR